MGLTFQDVLEEKLKKINEQKQYEMPYLLESALKEDGTADIKIVTSYPPAFAINEMQIAGQYDTCMTKVPILRRATIKMPELFMKTYKDSTFVVTIIPDITSEEKLPKNFFWRRNYKSQRFIANTLENGIANISREPRGEFPKGVLSASSPEYEEYRRVINDEGWVRGTDSIRVSVVCGGKYHSLLKSTVISDIVDSQYNNMVHTLYKASKMHPKKDHGN